MATKMANWIAYQERHLSPEAFAAWKASDVKVQSYLAKQDRVPAVCRNLDDFQKDIGKKVMLPAIQHASDWLATIEKTAAAADQDSGTLTQSIGSTKARILPGATFCGYVASGPRRGYARAVQIVATQRGTKRKRMSKKFTMTTPTTLLIKNPVAYSRYLRSGRKAIVASGQRGGILLFNKGGTFFRHGVKAAAPKDFMRNAEVSAESAGNMATCDMQLNLQRLLPE